MSTISNTITQTATLVGIGGTYGSPFYHNPLTITDTGVLRASRTENPYSRTR